jgi:multimeric flavodoxin WrbA
MQLLRYGHVYKLATKVAEGLNSVEGVEAEVYQASHLYMYTYSPHSMNSKPHSMNSKYLQESLLHVQQFI